MGEQLHGVVQFEPFLEAFVWLITMPLVLAAMVQAWAVRSGARRSVSEALGCCTSAALTVLPLYLAFAVMAPFIGWLVAQAFRLDLSQARTVAFSYGHAQLACRPAARVCRARRAAGIARHRGAQRSWSSQASSFIYASFRVLETAARNQ